MELSYYYLRSGELPLLHVAEKYGAEVALLAKAVYKFLPWGAWGFNAEDIEGIQHDAFLTYQTREGNVVISDQRFLQELFRVFPYEEVIPDKYLQESDELKKLTLNSFNSFLASSKKPSHLVGIMSIYGKDVARIDSQKAPVIHGTHWDFVSMMSDHGYSFSNPEGEIMSPEESVQFPDEFHRRFVFPPGNRKAAFTHITKDVR